MDVVNIKKLAFTNYADATISISVRVRMSFRFVSVHRRIRVDALLERLEVEHFRHFPELAWRRAMIANRDNEHCASTSGVLNYRNVHAIYCALKCVRVPNTLSVHRICNLECSSSAIMKSTEQDVYFIITFEISEHLGSLVWWPLASLGISESHVRVK